MGQSTETMDHESSGLPHKVIRNTKVQGQLRKMNSNPPTLLAKLSTSCTTKHDTAFYPEKGFLLPKGILCPEGTSKWSEEGICTQQGEELGVKCCCLANLRRVSIQRSGTTCGAMV